MESIELMHYGVKGMKWGVRRARKEYKNLAVVKGEYKHAKKAYDRSFSYAYNNSKDAYSPSRVRRAQNNARWADVNRDAERMKAAKKVYKDKKKEVRENAPIAAKLERGGKAVGTGLAVVGGMYLYDQVYLGGIGSKTAKAAVSKAYNTLMDKTFKYTVMDSAGKVLKRFN